MVTAKNLLIFGALVLVFFAYAIFPGVQYSGVGANRFEQSSMGHFENGVDWKASTVDENISLLSVATVYANISRSTFFVAVGNGSILYAKSHIFCIYHRSNVSSSVEFPVTSKNIREIYVAWKNYTFVVYVRWVSSVREVPELSESEFVTVEYMVARIWQIRVLLIIASVFGIVAGIKVRRWRK